MKKLLLLSLLLLALTQTSCRRAIEKARRNIRVERVEKVDRHALSGLDVTLRVVNDTGYKLEFSQAWLELFYAGSSLGTISLREAIEIPRRTTLSLFTQWRLRITDPIGLFALSRKLDAAGVAQVSVSFAVVGRGGPAKINIEREMVPLSEFLNTFGLSVEDITNYLKK